MNEFEPVQPEPLPSESTAAEAPRATLHRLFFGDDGLRAGWSVLIFIILLVCFSFLLNIIIRHFHLLPKPAANAASLPLTPKNTIVSDGLTFAVTAFVAWLMSLIEHRPFSRYGITARCCIPDLFAGFFWGFFCLSTLIGLLLLTHAIVFDGLALHGQAALSYGAKWLICFLLVGLTEEFLTRGYIQYTVARGVAGITRALDPKNRHSHLWGFWVSAFIFSACLFMLAHVGNKGETPWGIAQVGFAGGVFAFSLYRTGSLWWAIGFHCTWDWAQSFFYGTSDSGLAALGHFINSHPAGSAILSGGNTGPEGSILCTPIFLLILAIIHFTLPRRDYPLTPDQSPLEAAPADQVANRSSVRRPITEASI